MIIEPGTGGSINSGGIIRYATLNISFSIPTVATPGANGISIVAMNYLQD